MSPPLVEVRGLRFGYPVGRRGAEQPFTLALDEWSVAEGARVALFGPSGCGKSTLLNLVAGILEASEGSLKLCGTELVGRSDAGRRALRISRVGFVFQDFPLVDYLDARENVLFPYRLNRALRLDGEARGRAEALLEALGLGHRLRSRPAELSQGERHRVAIARALVTEPRLLLADEPTTGLDPERTLATMELLEEVCGERGVGLLMVTHDPQLLSRFEQTLEVAACTHGGTAEGGA